MTVKVTQTNVNSPELQHALVKAILEASPDGILVVNGEGIIVSYNHRFIEIWDLPINSQTAESKLDVSIGADDEPLLALATERVKNSQAFLERVKELYSHPELIDQCELELKDGRILERNSSALRGSTGQYLGRVWFFRDITAQKAIETQLVILTRIDPLTNITNRRYFIERATEEFIRTARYHSPLSIVSLDIDHFKLINDKYGHAGGDEALKYLCLNIKPLIRSTDLFARIGGEEFAILMPSVEQDGAYQITERIRQVIDNHRLLYNEHEIHFTISLGVTSYRSTDVSIDDCLNRADKAMYKAKKNGRNRVESEI